MAKKTENVLPDHDFLMKDSHYRIVHYNSSQSDITEFEYGSGSRVVDPEQIQFSAGGMGNGGHAHRLYSDGREAIIASGSARVAKFQLVDGRLDLINEIVIPECENDYMSGTELRELVDALDQAGTDDDEFVAITQDVVRRTGFSLETVANGMYTVMDCDGYYYAGYGTKVYKFSDATPGDASSEIKIAKVYDVRDGLPDRLGRKVSRFLGINMTYDGYLVLALSGVIGVLDRDLERFWYASTFGEAVDNGVVVDEQHGIYVVTEKNMRKLVWTGDGISRREKDGAWVEPYDCGPKDGSISRGAGTTPTLMGFGADADRLVLIADQGEPEVKVVAFWRDEIPEDAQQVEGAESKRTAGSIAIKFDVATTIEWSPHVHGYGIMVFNSEFQNPVMLESDEEQIDILSTMLSAGQTEKRPAAVGAQKFEWDPDKHQFKTDPDSGWLYDKEGLAWTLSPVSTTENVVYLNTITDALYKLVGLDWETGEEVGSITLGRSVKFNTGGTFLSPRPDGSLYLHGFFGPVRISDVVPKDRR